jgi:hypothetical protein
MRRNFAKRAFEMVSLAVPADPDDASLVIELEPGIEASQRQRRQQKVIVSRRRQALDLAPEVIGEPARPPAFAGPIQRADPVADDLGGPRGKVRTAAEISEPGHALEQHEARLVPKGKRDGEGLRPGKGHRLDGKPPPYGPDTLVAGAAPERTRAIWGLDAVEVDDGGPDGDADTEADNSLFATQGVFVP